MTIPPEPTWPGALGRWEWDPAVIVAVVAAAVAYRRACRVVAGARPRHPVSRGRQGLLYGGLAVVAVALLSPVATYADALLSVHMVQHLLLTLVAAPLLAAARPLAVALTAASPGLRRRVLRLAGTAWARFVAHPLVSWVTFAAVGWVVHFTPLFELALERPWAHALEHGLLLGSALLFWRPVFAARGRGRGTLTHPMRLVYLAVAMPQNTFLALAIFSAGHPLYRHYVRAHPSWARPPLSDQRLAGGLMWVAGDLAFLAAVLLAAAAWARHEDAETRRAEAEADAARGAGVGSSARAGRPPSPRTAG